MNICETSSYITSYINDSVLIFVKEHVFFIRLGMAHGPLMTSNILVHFLNENHTHDDFKKAYYDVFGVFFYITSASPSWRKDKTEQNKYVKEWNK